MTHRPLLLRGSSSESSGLTAVRVEDPRQSGNPDGSGGCAKNTDWTHAFINACSDTAIALSRLPLYRTTCACCAIAFLAMTRKDDLCHICIVTDSCRERVPVAERWTA